jgi:DNA-binding beta-propeller fold protein YncE
MRCSGLPLLALLVGCLDEPPCTEGAGGTVCTIAGTGDSVFDGDGRDAMATSFYRPSQARRGPDGLLYVMDFSNMRLRRIQPDGTVLTIAGNGEHLGASEGLPATQSSLENPIDFDFLSDGRVVFVSLHDPRVLVIERDGTLQCAAGSPFQGVRGNEGDGDVPERARFMELEGIAIGADDTIYVADGLANRVRVIDGVTDTLAGTGLRAYLGDGGPANEAALQSPRGLALDAAGNLYIADALNCVVRRVATDGVITTVAGTGTCGFGGDGGPAIAAQLAYPDGIAVRDDGTLFISDRKNHRIRAVAPDGTITTIAGTGTAGFSGDGGPALAAELGGVSRITLDDDGGLLVVDQSNNRVRKILSPLAL